MKSLYSRTRPATGTGTGRRRFLKGLGAAGLGTSVAVFGNATSASADPPPCNSCCKLVFCPPNISYTTCRNSRNYVWSCRDCWSGGCVTCVCCERLGSNENITGSALDCRLT